MVQDVCQQSQQRDSQINVISHPAVLQNSESWLTSPDLIVSLSHDNDCNNRNDGNSR